MSVGRSVALCDATKDGCHGTCHHRSDLRRQNPTTIAERPAQACADGRTDRQILSDFAIEAMHAAEDAAYRLGTWLTDGWNGDPTRIPTATPTRQPTGSTPCASPPARTDRTSVSSGAATAPAATEQTHHPASSPPR
jgi:hypothetical protein